MFSANTILSGGSVLLVALVIFAETGLLFGFIFPGDTLLIVAGYFASEGKISLAQLLPAVIVAAILGYQTGYSLGHRFGPRIFSRQDGFLFRREYIEKTQDFFGRHGGKTILLARFVPYVRTFTSLVAGVGSMNRRVFAFYNVIGGILWAGGATMVGYWLGHTIPNLDKYVVLVALASLLLLHTGTFWHLWHDKSRRASVKKAIAEEFNHYFRRKKA